MYYPGEFLQCNNVSLICKYVWSLAFQGLGVRMTHWSFSHHQSSWDWQGAQTEWMFAQDSWVCD